VRFRAFKRIAMYDIVYPNYDTERGAEDCVRNQEEYIGDLALGMQESQATLTQGIHYVIEKAQQ